jgi:hypothetical protein
VLVDNVAVSVVITCVDDSRTEELSVEVETLFIVVSEAAASDDEVAVVSIEVIYEFDVLSIVLVIV